MIHILALANQAIALPWLNPEKLIDTEARIVTRVLA